MMKSVDAAGTVYYAWTGDDWHAPETAPSGNRENGQRLGVRFRRGSRGPLRPGEIPLIGMVQIEPPEPTVNIALSRCW